ncbi:MAG: metallophosphoesterase [Clostridia bacterium]|nr:metallophosphoesterase [Clostridia bacterium]
MIRFLHLGDMHLDSPFSGLSVQESERMRQALRELFGSIMRDASLSCDAALISGDLFDQGFVSPDTVAYVKKVLGDFGSPVFIAPGNHDPYNTASVWNSGAWPDNVHLFTSSSLGRFDTEIEGQPVTVWGWAFTSPKLDDCPIPAGFTAEPDRINIICAHADTSSVISRYCPMPLSLIEGSGCEYTALGHIHKAPEPVYAGKTVVSYSGFPQGRGWDEPGQGRVLYVEVEKGRAKIRIHPTGFRRYSELDLDITGSGSDSETAEMLCAAIPDDIYPQTSLKVYLCGAVTPSYKPEPGKILDSAAVRDGIDIVFVDETSPVLGAEYLESDMSVRGELYRALLPRLSSEDRDERKLASDALRIGLLALDNKPFV